MKKILYALLALTLLAVYGCGDTNNSSVTNPNSNIFTPKGTVTGVLTDTVTLQPIANARVFIYDRSATTGEQGQFSIYDVPANTAVGTETGTASGAPYNLVIDMADVNRSITDYNADPAHATTQKAKYPAIAYTSVSVSYTSLGETSGASGLGTNHDTPVNGFVANVLPKVGKLDGFLKVQVVTRNDTDYTSVTGAVVELLSHGAGSLPNAPTGTDDITPGHLVATATTDANGIASFGPVEAGTSFTARATSSDSLLKGSKTVTTEGDNITVSYLVQNDNGPLTIAAADEQAPFVVSSSPANLADVAVPATGNLDVVFTFSEPIKATNYAKAVTADLAVNGGLFADVAVNTNGPKVGNILHTLAWSTDRTKLTVSIPATSLVAAYKYSVVLTGTSLVDDSNNAVADVVTVNFTTAGGFNVAAPVVTQSSTSASVVSWTHVTNAVDYNVYVKSVTNAVKTSFGPYATGGAITYNLATSPAFTGYNGGATTYEVTVKAENSNGSEGDASNIITISDTLLAAPTVALPVLTGATFDFNWLPVANAVSYQYSVETVTAGIGGGYAAPVAAPFSQLLAYTPGAFTSGEQKVTYNIKFRSVNGNGTPGAWSTPLVLEDKVTPSIASRANGTSFLTSIGSSTLAALAPSTTTGLNGNNMTADYTFTVTFTEQMVKSAVQTNANWSVSKGTATNGGLFVAGAADVLPVVKSVVYNPNTLTATVTITYTNDATNTATTDPGHTVFTYSGADLNGNAIKATADSVDFANVAAF